MLRNLTLRTRVVLATLLSVALGLTIAFFGSFWVARDIVLESVSSHLRTRASNVMETFLRYQHASADRVAAWAGTDAMSTSLDSGDPKFAEDHLLRTAQSSAFALVALVDARSRVITAVRPTTSDRAEVISELAGKPFPLPPEAVAARAPRWVGLAPDELTHHAPGATRLLFASPVVDFTGEVQAHVVALMKQEAIERLLSEARGQSGEERSARAVLFDASSAVAVAVPPVPGAGDAATVAELRATWRRASSSSEATAELTLGGERQLVYGAIRPPDESPRWSTALLMSEREALGPLFALRRILVALFAGVLLVAGVASVLTLRRASGPLAEVVASMGKVAQGDLSTRLAPQPAADLGRLVEAFNGMVAEVSESREKLARTEALRREVQIAHDIQTTLLPRELSVPGFRIAARSRPATEVGGDFYDVLRTPESFWFLIGDVSGHGLNAGLVMLMVQAAAQSALSAAPNQSPVDLVRHLNRMLHENIRNRMRGDDYVALVAGRHEGDGRFVAAGAHTPLLVVREGGTLETLEPRGAWCGVAPDISGALEELRFELRPRDTLLLYTDGLPEAMNEEDKLFGDERLASAFLGLRTLPPDGIVDGLFRAVLEHSKSPADDLTAVVMVREG